MSIAWAGRRALAVMMAVALLACGDDGGEARPIDGGDDPPSCPGASQGPSQGCEKVVATQSECPRVEDVCARVCGAAYDCCYCDQGEWRTVYLDCAPCPDAR
jgi:hypothetical protein